VNPARSAVVLVAFLSLCPQLHAGRGASFYLDRAAWHATDIVVANEGAIIDGTLTVLAVWDGKLAVGDSVYIPGLSKFAEEESRTVRTIFEFDRDVPPVVVSSQRMVLFLKRAKKESTPDKLASASAWQPASSVVRGIEESVAWIADDRAYAITQPISPGGSFLAEMLYSENEMRESVRSVVKICNQFRAATDLTDVGSRAKNAAKHVSSPRSYVRYQAFKMLAESGDDALPFLRRVLRDKSNVKLHKHAVEAFVTAGGEAVVPELTRMVGQELLFWKRAAPSLKYGWSKGRDLEQKRLEYLNDRYEIALAVFYALQKTKSPICKAAVEEFRDYWRSLPQLEDLRMPGELSQACDAVLQRLGE